MSITIPSDILPRDGRFGSGPSKIRPEQVTRLIDSGSVLGTSHRKPPVRNMVKRIQEGLTELFQLPDGYEVILGNGGASAVWDAIPFGLVQHTAQCAVIGEFSSKAARAMTRAPWLAETSLRKVEYGRMVQCEPAGVDTYHYAHNETSTGALTPIRRIDEPEALTIVDGTSIAGAYEFDASAVDFYYFSPQKAFASDGGLWIAFASPAALARIEHLTENRWTPDFLNLQLAVTNSRKNQTLNTPALATLTMLDEQIGWMLAEGGMPEMARRSKTASDLIYTWADERDFAAAFVAEPMYRSPVVTTIDLDTAIDSNEISAILRANGVVDIDPYRSLQRNQFRIGTFPAVEASDVAALLACIDYIIEQMA